MRNIQIILIILFLVGVVAFGMTFGYNYFYSDKESPVIYCENEDSSIEVSVTATKQELCAGLRARDNASGDITDRIQVKSVSTLVSSNSAQVTYVVFDDASNAGTYTRTVVYTDYEKPHYALSKPLLFGVGQTVTLLDRLTASDILDGDISNKIRLTMVNLTNDTAGSYNIRVMVTNSLGDTSMIPLTIIIRNTPIGSPTIELSEYIVYTKVGKPLNLEDYILSVDDPAAPSGRGNIKNVEITSSVNYQSAGAYDVCYSYVGTTGLQYDVILTVIVE